MQITLDFFSLLIIGALFILYRRNTKLDTKVHLLEKRIEVLENPVTEASYFEFYTIIDGKLQKVDEMFLKVSQELPISLAIKDKFGNPAKVDGLPAWALTDSALGSLEIAADGMSAKFKPAGPIGLLKVQVSADADLGEGVKSILGELDIELLAGEAVSLELAAGTPVDL